MNCMNVVAGCAYKICHLIKYKKIELIILQVKYAIGNKSKANHGANKKRKYDY